MKRTTIRIIACLCACALGMFALAGCQPSANSNPEAEAQAANRTYMSQVNQLMDDISVSLEQFSAAVSANDLTEMRAKATSASKSIDELAALEAPEGLAEVQADYSQGCTLLRDALNAYVTLYTDVENAESVDALSYQERLTAIQESYNQGIQKLSDGDEKAAALPA